MLGKHTDYAGGRSLVATIERGICLVAVADAGQPMSVCDAGVAQSAEFLSAAAARNHDGVTGPITR